MIGVKKLYIFEDCAQNGTLQNYWVFSNVDSNDFEALVELSPNRNANKRWFRYRRLGSAFEIKKIE